MTLARAPRQVLTRDEASIWPGMSPPAKAAVKAEMLNCIKEEQQRAVTKKASERASGGGGGAGAESSWLAGWLAGWQAWMLEGACWGAARG